MLIILGLIYLISRLVYIDADLPSFEMFQYSQIDELYYSIPAFQLVEKIPEEIFALSAYDSMPLTAIQDILTAISLKLFGDNYFGLRINSIIYGLLILVIWFIVYYKRFGLSFAFWGSLVLISEIGFLIATRSMQTTIFMLLTSSLLVVLFISNQDKQEGMRTSFLLGLITMILWLGVYPTNFYAYVASIVLLIFFLPLKAWIRHLGLFIGGSFLAITILLLLWKIKPDGLTNFQGILDFANRVASPEIGFLQFLSKLKTNLINIKQSTYFAFNSYFFLLAFAALFFFIIRKYFDYKNSGHGILKMPKTDVIITVFFILFVLQTLIINDFPRKKLLILLPLIIYYILFMISSFPVKRRALRSVIISLLLLPIILISLHLDYKYVYKMPTKHYKTAMINLSKYDGKIIAGNFSYGFRLYNDFIPVINIYRYKYNPEKMDLYRSRMGVIMKHPNFVGTISYSDFNIWDKDLDQILLEENLCFDENIIDTDINYERQVGFFKPCENIKSNNKPLLMK